MTHKSGTKDYDIFVLRDSIKNATLVVRRWGVVGAVGQAQSTLHTNVAIARSEVGTLIKQKTSGAKGYSVESEKERAFSGDRETVTLMLTSGYDALNRMTVASDFKRFLDAVDFTLEPGEFVAAAPFPPSKPEGLDRSVERPESWGTW
jgi:predicted DNA-binding WGR domain protein